MRTGLTEQAIRRLYVDLGKTDIQIADFFNVDRTSIVHLRRRYGIHSRKSVGEIGEEMVEKELRSRGLHVVNMNEHDKLHPFDLLVNGSMRIEVKSSTLHEDGYFAFPLTEKESNQNAESETRIRLKTGRTKKLFSKTCDLLIFVGIESNGDCHFFLIRPSELNTTLYAVKAPLNPFSKSKYNNYREDWGVLDKIKKSDATNIGPKQNLSY